LAGLLPGLPSGLFLRSEYRYSSFSSKDIPIVVTATGASTGIGEHVTKYVQTIGTSVVWKFNWMGH
jgi:opacity protein-like surface antigen